jgi:cytochrome c oxidase cbb3-type subunit 4
MGYEAVATVSQVLSLLLFLGLFLAVLVYALRPKNAKRFEDAQRRALDLEQANDRDQRPS